MTRSITAAGKLLTASVDDRTLTYRLLPYGEEGRTSIGRVTAARGSVTVPADPASVVLNLQHDRTRPVGRAVTITEDDAGLSATFRVVETTAGNDLLAEAAAGLRPGVSVEIESPVVRAGRLVRGLLTAAGAVTQPAFPSALLTAADTGDLDDDDPASTTEDEEDPEDDPTTDADAAPADPNGDTPVTRSTAAAAPADLRAAARGGTGNTMTASINEPADLFRMLAEANRTQDRTMLAALADITQASVGVDMEQPQWVGELWSGRAYQRKFIPLLNHANLTSFEVAGWRWTTKPGVGPYAGDKTEIPTNVVATEPVTLGAERIAGGHDIDRKFRDFPNPSFWSSYYAAMTESYARQSDAAALQDVVGAATAVAVGAQPASGPVPVVWLKIVDGALAVLDGVDSPPTFAVIASDLYREFLLTPQDQGLEYLNAALGLEEGVAAGFRVIPSATMAAGSALVGARDAVTFHELGGGAPIRVDAENITLGGIDTGVFGYYATNVHAPGGLALVTGTPPAG